MCLRHAASSQVPAAPVLVRTTPASARQIVQITKSAKLETIAKKKVSESEPFFETAGATRFFLSPPFAPPTSSTFCHNASQGEKLDNLLRCRIISRPAWLPLRNGFCTSLARWLTRTSGSRRTLPRSLSRSSLRYRPPCHDMTGPFSCPRI